LEWTPGLYIRHPSFKGIRERVNMTGREFLNLKVVQKTGADQEYLSTVGLAA
jgi:hypothetical protein